MKRILNKKTAKHFSVFFAAAALVQVVFLLASISNSLSAQVSCSATNVGITLYANSIAPYQNMTVNGSETLSAAVNPSMIVLANGPSEQLSGVSFYLDSSATAYLDAGLTAVNNGTDWSANLSSYSSLASGSYDFYAKAFFGSCEIVSQHYTIYLHRDSTVSSPSPAATAVSLNITLSDVPSSSTGTASAVISGIKSVGATSNSSFPGLNFYLIKTADSTNYSASALFGLDYPVSGSQGMNWSGTLDAAKLSGGNYDLYAEGQVNGSGSSYVSNHIYFAVSNPAPSASPESSAVPSPSPSPSPSPATSPSTSASGSASAAPYLNAWIDTVSYSSSPASPVVISGIKNAGVTANSSFSNLNFYLNKITSTGAAADSTNYYTSTVGNLSLISGSQGMNWSGTINTVNLANGAYKFFSKGSYNGAEYASNHIYFKVDNSSSTASTPEPSPAVNSATPAPAPTPTAASAAPTSSPASSTSPIIKIGLGDSAAGGTVSGTSISGTRTLGASSTLPLSELSFRFYNIANGNINSTYQPAAANMDSSYKYWSVPFDTTRLANGDYKAIAKGMYNKTYYEFKSDFYFNINNGSQPSAPSPSSSIAATASSAPAPSPAPYNSAVSSPYPASYGGNFATTDSSGTSVSSGGTAGQFPEECRDKNIFDPEKCKQFMMQLGMPEPCRASGVTTPEECTKIMMAQSMPQECREANTATEEACNKVMFIKYGLKECVDAGIFDKDGCEKFIFKKNAPPECLDQGIFRPDDCEKYMIGKYGNMDNISQDKLPVDCQKAGVKTAEDCDQVMKDKYMPKDCKDQGIGDIAQCDAYLNVKYMPADCREAGAKTKEDCNKVMFKKFSPEPCKKAGIENEKECKDFMFNLYAPRVVCSGLNDWDCKREIKENHLGNIVAKQENYKKIKEDVSSFSGKSASVEKIKEKIGQDSEIVPLIENSVVLKIVSGDEKMVLSDEENLVQTAPIIVAIDSDGDGIPDDTEKRIGIDPNNRDADNDGFSDSEEIKNGFNPLGSGKITQEMKDRISPVDWALVQDKTLGHPTVDGTESEDLAVSNFASASSGGTDSSAGGYELAGKGEKNSVMTIYIYSDMPVVATVKTDEFGNWKYELDKSLVDGEHEVYVAINDNTGKVVNKSRPFSFFINEAKAVSVSDFITSQNTAVPKDSEKAISSYAIAALAAIIAGIIIFIFIVIKRKKRIAA